MDSEVRKKYMVYSFMDFVFEGFDTIGIGPLGAPPH